MPLTPESLERGHAIIAGAKELCGNRKALLTLNFANSLPTEIIIEKVIELDVPDHGRNEISFRQTAKGWVMAVSRPLLMKGLLAEEFLSVRKITPESPSQ